VPVTGGRARLWFWAAHQSARALGPLKMQCNGAPVTALPGRAGFNLARYRAEIDLKPEGPTLLQLDLAPEQQPRPASRLAIGALHLAPL
jgi:hypothetical protein